MISIKQIKKVLRQIAYLVVALLLFTWVINWSWFDEALHPQLKILRTPQPVTLENNAYPLVWGLMAANNKDPFTAGEAVIERERQLYDQGKKIEIAETELAEIMGGQDLDNQWQDFYAALKCNTRQSLDCASELLDEVRQKGLTDQRLRLVIDRYENLLRQEHFQENQEGDAFSPLPSYTLLMNVSRVRLCDRALNNEPSEFIGIVNQDLRFWKTMLREGDYLIAKMVALAGMRHNLQLVSTLVKQNYFSVGDLQQLQAVILPLTEEERDIGETFDAEMRINLLTWDARNVLYGDPSWIQKLFWQENATLNDIYLKIISPIHILSELSPKEFYQRQGFKQQGYQVRVFPPDLYNLGGKLALKESLGSWNVQDYITRVNDNVGQISALRLQIEIAMNADKDIQDVIRKSQYRNPYTREAMNYDPVNKTLGFDCLSPGQTNICRVQL